ncbi:S41 family peptidase [Thalassomonas haliotis]|uniref:Peptidase S41 n=1 Tax=Thalassomonas haliotis TaxID=485448 RepID=A0ABY7VKT7_9GAMM|nr:S41 family peptidase [Thalassomonas haliotis]WDE14344.1 peptidase S41 [Thalassomonas haliotis]
MNKIKSYFTLKKVALFACLLLCQQGYAYSDASKATAMANTANHQVEQALTMEEKIYGLSLFWKEVSYNFAYFDQVAELDWDATYIRYLAQVHNTKNNFEYYRLMSRLAAELKDGMTLVKMPAHLVKQYIDFPAIKLAEAEGKAIVVSIEASVKDRLPVGAIILAVDKEPVLDKLKRDVFPYISSSTEHIKLDKAIQGSYLDGYGLLAGAPGSWVDIQFQHPDGQVKNVSLERNMTGREIHWHASKAYTRREADKKASISFRQLEDGISYISINNFYDDEIVDKFKAQVAKIQQTKGLILDIRANGGGNTMIAEEILKYLTFHDLTGAKSKMRVHNATYKAWGKYGEQYAWARKYKSYFLDQAWSEVQPDVLVADDVPRNEKIVVPTVILIGRETSGAAEDFLLYADGADHLITIGEPTFGSTGQPLILDLPGGGTASICTKRDTYADGRDFVGYGIMPDIQVTRSIDYYMTNVDMGLKAARDYLHNEFKQGLPPEKKLANLN